jgi:hypothetical protein
MRTGTLFDQITRDDPSPASHGEDSFTFMNRVDQPLWARIRDVLDGWFAEYPRAAAADLRARYRAADSRQHVAAWWELYLFTLYRRLGYGVTVHPTVPGRSGQPDFLITRQGEEIYVEAAVVNSGVVDDEDRHGAREGWIYDLVNEARNPNFHVQLEFERVGMQRPKAAEIVQPLERWLRDHDPDAVAQAIDAGEDLPELVLPVRDWTLVFTPLPIKPERRGRRGRLLGIYPASGGLVNDKEMVRKTLERKRRQFGRLDSPFVVALLATSSFMADEDIAQALFGSEAVQYRVNDPTFEPRTVRQRDGFLMPGHRPRGTRVSAVLVGKSLFPWTCARELPHLWLNPWAVHPLIRTDPFSTTTADERPTFTTKHTDAKAFEVLGLPEQWPGPEPPFVDD